MADCCPNIPCQYRVPPSVISLSIATTRWLAASILLVARRTRNSRAVLVNVSQHGAGRLTRRRLCVNPRATLGAPRPRSRDKPGARRGVVAEASGRLRCDPTDFGRRVEEAQGREMAVLFGWLVTDALFAALACAALWSLSRARALGYWRRRGVPSAPGALPFLGALRRESWPALLLRVHKMATGHPLVGVYGACGEPQLVVRDPGLARRVLAEDSRFFLDGDFQPARAPLARSVLVLAGRPRRPQVLLCAGCAPGEAEAMFPRVNGLAEELVRSVHREIARGNAVDVQGTAARFCTDALARCVFGADPGGGGGGLRLAVREVREPGAARKMALALQLCVPWLLSALGAAASPGRLGEFVRVTEWDVAERRAASATVRRGDRAKLGSSRPGVDSDGEHVATRALVFTLASFETCTCIVRSALFELALNPAIQDRLRGEITAVLGRRGAQLTCHSLAKMPYLDMVVSESMRKYPVLPAMRRECLSAYKVPGTGVTVDKGTTLWISVLGMHSDPELYPEPSKFNPERFNSENRRKRLQFAYLPLDEGSGMRAGLRFGRMQAKTALVHLLSQFRVWPCPATPRPLPPGGRVVLAFAELR
ncbi:cytochrome P450 6k1-like [Bacillus rossius redtenbacheri]|uniref:cytochrome P450 6k1-like n=1 Tax=Bacillus rossius redtenbacheri TaxID=93214 RepID=UPI002FDE9F80